MMKFKGSIIFNDNHSDKYKSIFGDDKNKYRNANMSIQIKERSKKDLPKRKKEYSLILKVSDINVVGNYKYFSWPWMYNDKIEFICNIEIPLKLDKQAIVVKPQKYEDRQKLLDFLKNNGKTLKEEPSKTKVKKTKGKKSKGKKSKGKKSKVKKTNGKKGKRKTLKKKK